MLPYRTRTFMVASAPEVVTAELRKHVGERELLSFERVKEPFRGTVGADTFKLSREIDYRNSFLPVIVGTVKRAGGGSEVSVVLRLHHFVLVFMSMWIGSPLLSLLIAVFDPQKHAWGHIAIPCGMLAFAVVLTTLPFKLEADKAERILNEIFAKL